MSGEREPTTLADNDRFVLGEINAVVKSLPSRMDRFETQTSSQLTDIRREFSQNVAGLNSRVQMLEQNSAHRSGVTGTLTMGITLAAAFIASLLSGLFPYFLGRGH